MLYLVLFLIVLNYFNVITILKYNKKMGEIKSFVFFDIETSGLPYQGSQIKMTELSFVACSKEHILNTKLNDLPRVLYKLSFCVNPCRRMQCESSIISGN